jgi:CheY-like chemotaxis protein
MKRREEAPMSSTVLVVEQDECRRDQVGGWLEGAGFDVLACPGPSAPSYTCLASCNAPCPLAAGADVVVLDMHLAPDDALQGTPGWELLLYYLDRGRRIVVLSGPDDAMRPHSDDGVVVVRRPPDRRTLIDAVAQLAGREGGDADGDDPAR